MGLSRKDFFRQGLFALGKGALQLTGLLEEAQGQAEVEQAQPQRGSSQLRAEPYNARCLARSCGCLACVERCAKGAITVAPGEGIVIDPMRCTGCGSCEEICPLSPKGVALAPWHG